MTDLSPEYIVDVIMPHHEIHLLAGPSGSGKTTLIAQQLMDNWQEGKTIFGYRVHPVKFAYVSADRSKEGTLRTFKRLGVDPNNFPHLSLTGRKAKADGLRNPFRLLDWFYKYSPETKLLVIDGFMGLVPPRRDRNTDGGFAHISDFLTSIQSELPDRDLTIQGIAHATKSKEDARYTNPRERIMGSAAWAAHTETITVIEPTAPDDSSAIGQRTLILCPRNAPEQYIPMHFSNGRLIETNIEAEQTISAVFLAQLKEDEVFSTKDAIEALMAKGVSKSTAERELREWEQDGRIVRVCKGRYRKARRN